jgi:hypothetical protein
MRGVAAAAISIAVLLGGCAKRPPPTALVLEVEVATALDCVSVTVASAATPTQAKQAALDLTAEPYRDRDYRHLWDLGGEPPTLRALPPLRVLVTPGPVVGVGKIALVVTGLRSAGGGKPCEGTPVSQARLPSELVARKIGQATVVLVPGCAEPPCDADGDGWAAPDDCDDADPANAPGNAELCDDDRDNNCNGLADEGCPCTPGEPGKPCYPFPGGLSSPTLQHPWDGSGGCAAGAQACVNVDATGHGTWDTTCAGAHLPRPEKCDGLDEDCDGIADPPSCGCVDGKACYTGPPDTLGHPGALCHAGLWDCAQPAGSQCVGEVLPLDHEECNGKDDDCNGKIDDRARTDPCGQGVCAALLKSCIGGAQAACDYVANPPPSYNAAGDICGDGLDNDCNGLVDDTCPCTVAATQPCWNGPPAACPAGAGCQGICARGTQVCEQVNPTTTRWGSCTGQTLPAPEVCNALDDDCNGTVDDSPQDVGGGCLANALGACRFGTWTCPAGTSVRECTAAKPRPNEYCTGSADLTCDGLVGCADPTCEGNPCGLNGLVCAGGACACGGNGGTPEASESTCDDGFDNDCNGLRDCEEPACDRHRCDPARPAAVCCGTGRTSSVCKGLGRDDDNCGGCGIVCPHASSGFHCSPIIFGGVPSGACQCNGGGDCPPASAGVVGADQHCANKSGVHLCTCENKDGECAPGETCQVANGTNPSSPPPNFCAY